MKKFLISLICLTSTLQATSFEQEKPDYYEDKMTTKFIIEEGHELFLQNGSFTLSNSTTMLVKKGGIVKIGPEFSLENITLKDNSEIIDENLGITLTVSSPREYWEKWEKFYKLSEELNLH